MNHNRPLAIVAAAAPGAPARRARRSAKSDKADAKTVHELEKQGIKDSTAK
jgi:hypothetical protein